MGFTWKISIILFHKQNNNTAVMLAGWCKMHGPFQHPGLSSQKSVILYYCVAQLHFRTFILKMTWNTLYFISYYYLTHNARKFPLEGRLSWKKWHWLPVEVPQTQRSTWVTSRKGKRGEQAGQITSWLTGRPAESSKGTI